MGEDVISKDDLRTGEGRMEVQFVDDSKLRMTEHTRIVIDNVVFDEDPSKSELAMTFAQGTARFVSGQLGSIDKENIRLKTPTASIGIRGTDFTVTVDEFGSTLVVLLPDVNGISSGEIIVSTMTGEVTLNKPFESTRVTVAESLPSAPAILDLSLDMLNNIMIINPPKVKQSVDDFYGQVGSTNNVNPLDFDFLDDDFGLSESELDQDQLEFTELDIDYLDVELLEDLLDNFDDLTDELRIDDQSSGGGQLSIKGTEEGFDTVTQVITLVDNGEVTFKREVSSKAEISVGEDTSTTLNIEQDGKVLDPIALNNGGDTTITIIQ
jgi:hypothetical protein|tara:strand:+ start:3871 stop:4842 length:972 start_codon:yes stop_codon:yes gene_type:complete